MSSGSEQFDGCVIGESLRDPTIVNGLAVWRAWITAEEMLSDDQGTMTRWHIYWIRGVAADIARVQAELKPWRWYAHFWRSDRMIVVFHDGRFEMDRTDRATWIPAIAHGRAKGVPDEQLDFLVLPREA